MKKVIQFVALSFLLLFSSSLNAQTLDLGSTQTTTYSEIVAVFERVTFFRNNPVTTKDEYEELTRLIKSLDTSGRTGPARFKYKSVGDAEWPKADEMLLTIYGSQTETELDYRAKEWVFNGNISSREDVVVDEMVVKSDISNELLEATILLPNSSNRPMLKWGRIKYWLTHVISKSTVYQNPSFIGEVYLDSSSGIIIESSDGYSSFVVLFRKVKYGLVPSWIGDRDKVLPVNNAYEGANVIRIMRKMAGEETKH